MRHPSLSQTGTPGVGWKTLCFELDSKIRKNCKQYQRIVRNGGYGPVRLFPVGGEPLVKNKAGGKDPETNRHSKEKRGSSQSSGRWRRRQTAPPPPIPPNQPTPPTQAATHQHGGGHVDGGDGDEVIPPSGHRRRHGVVPRQLRHLQQRLGPHTLGPKVPVVVAS